LLADPDVRAGRLDTGLVGRRLDGLVRDALPADVLPAAAGLALAALEPSGDVVDPFDIPGGWRVGEPAEVRWQMTVSGTTVTNTETNEVRARGRAASALVAAGDADPVRVRVAHPVAGSGGTPGPGGRVPVTVAGVTRDYAVAWDNTGARDGAT